MDATELKAILAQHKLWIESGRKKGKHAHLLGANLQGADLRFAYLRFAYLQGANLHGAYLQDANLQDANLYGADLQGTNLQDANLYGADLQGATFDLNFKQVRWFANATFSEDQIPWVCLHPKYPEWADTLKWVKAEKLSA